MPVVPLTDFGLFEIARYSVDLPDSVGSPHIFEDRYPMGEVAEALRFVQFRYSVSIRLDVLRRDNMHCRARTHGYMRQWHLGFGCCKLRRASQD